MVRRSSPSRLFIVLALASLGLLAVAVLFEPEPLPAAEPRAQPPVALSESEPAPEREAADAAVESPTVVAEPVPLVQESGGDALTVQVVRWADGRALPEAEILVDPGPDGTLRWEPVARDGRVWLVWAETHTSVTVRARAEGFHEEIVQVMLSPEGAMKQIALRASEGYVGLVTTTLGDPVPRARVKVWRSWPARPTFVTPTGVVGQGPQLAVMPARGELLADVFTDSRGRFGIRAFDERNVVDLVLTVVGDESASEPLRVPMPYPERDLPVLVARPAKPLAGQLLDERGNPLAGLSIEVDRGPGAVRVVEHVEVTDKEGRFSLTRHLGQQHLRVQAPNHELVGAFDGELELPLVPSREPRRSPVETAGVPFVAQPPWIVVEPDIGELRVQLQGKGHVAGVISAARDDQGIEGALVTVSAATESGDWETLAFVRSEASGSFDALIPSADLHRSMRLAVSHPHYLSVSLDVAPSIYADDSLNLLRLADAVRQDELRLKFNVWSRSNLDKPQPQVFAFSDERGTVPLFDSEGLLRLPPDHPPFWEFSGAAFTHFYGRTTVPLPVEDGSKIVLLVKGASEEGEEVAQVTSWELMSADRGGRDWRVAPFAPIGDLRVDVARPGNGGRLTLRRTTWLPWFDVEQRDDVASVYMSGETTSRNLVPVFRPSWTRIELVEQRQPVDLVHDDSGEVEANDLLGPGPLQLTRQPDHLVTGRVTDHSLGDWPDLAVALCGPATESHRLKALGQTSWWARASEAFGDFRFEAVPAGVYTYLLYRPLDDEQVEVLAQRTVTVHHDLFNLDIWPEPQSSALRQFVRAESGF